MIAILEWTLSTTKHRTSTDYHNGSNNKQSQQQQNHQQPKLLGRGGLNAFYWYQIFALDSAVVVEVQEMEAF